MHCCGQVLPLSGHRCMPFASSVAGRGCRQRDLRVFHLHELVLAGAAAFEASTNAVHIQFCWQELPPARLQRMPLVGIVAGRSFRWQGVRACRRQPLLRAGAARGTASAHAVCTHCCWQEKPPLARHHRMTCAFIVASRCCRRRAPAHAACRHCRWQVLPLTRHRRMPVASSVAGRNGRRRDLSVCHLHIDAFRLHPLLLAGSATGEASSHVVCMHRSHQQVCR